LYFVVLDGGTYIVRDHRLVAAKKGGGLPLSGKIICRE
jgi:hypothetical protein